MTKFIQYLINFYSKYNWTENPSDPYVWLDENGNCPGSCYQDSRFHEGEKVDIPFSNIMVKILKVSDSIVEVQLLKNS